MSAADLYFETTGARLRYRDEGVGPAIVLLHGWTLDLEMWNPQADELGRQFRIVRWDRRGFGLSTGSPDIDLDVADVYELCRSRGIARATFVGMSQAARILPRLVSRRPELIASVVFDGSSDIVSKPERRLSDLPIESYRELVQQHGTEVFRREWSRHPLTRLRNPDPAMQALLQTMIGRYSGRDLSASMSNAPDDEAALALKDMTFPALVMNGEFDLPSRIRAAESLARELPRCERASVPRAGHLANMDNPGFYNDVLRSFVTRSAHRLPR